MNQNERKECEKKNPSIVENRKEKQQNHKLKQLERMKKKNIKKQI